MQADSGGFPVPTCSAASRPTEGSPTVLTLTRTKSHSFIGSLQVWVWQTEQVWVWQMEQVWVWQMKQVTGVGVRDSGWARSTLIG